MFDKIFGQIPGNDSKSVVPNEAIQLPKLLYVLRMPYNSKDEISLLEYLKQSFEVFACYLEVVKDFESQKDLLIQSGIESFSYKPFTYNKYLEKIVHLMGLQRTLQNIMEKRMASEWNKKFGGLKVVLSPVSTQPVTRAYCQLKKTLGIKVVTLQRTQNSYTPPWIEWLKKHETNPEPSFLAKVNVIISKLLKQEFQAKHDLFLVSGKGSFEIYEMEGVPAKTMTIVGHLENDRVHHYMHQTDVIKGTEAKKIRDDLGISANERIILVNLSPPHLLRDPKLKDGQTILIKELLLTIGPSDCILVIRHPRSKGEEINYHEFKDHPKIKIVDGFYYFDLFKISSLFISNNSTTIFDWICMDKPLLTVNLSRHYICDLNENVGGGFHIRYEDELPEVLGKFLHDDAFQKQILFNQKLSRSRWVRYDGKVKERIRQELLQLIQGQ